MQPSTKASIATAITAAALIGGGLYVFNREPQAPLSLTSRQRSVRSVAVTSTPKIDRISGWWFSNLPPTREGYVYPWGDVRKGDVATFQLLADGLVIHSQTVRLDGPPMDFVVQPSVAPSVLDRGWTARLVRGKWNYKGPPPEWAKTMNGLPIVEWK